MIDFSFLIVSHNRNLELEYTVQKLNFLFRESSYRIEILVLDDCSTTPVDSEIVMSSGIPLLLFRNDKKLGASRSRNKLYKYAKGKVLIGLDDDSAPLNYEILNIIDEIFKTDITIGLITFNEIKSTNLNIDLLDFKIEEYYTNDFIGCGFAILKDVYDKTNGFPIWMDIYGEESALAIEVIDLGYNIWYTNRINIQHRVDRQQRKLSKQNVFRFRRSLVNQGLYFMIYYPLNNAIKRVIKLYFHNLIKYAMKDRHYFLAYIKSFGEFIFSLKIIFKNRRIVKSDTILKIKYLTNIKY